MERFRDNTGLRVERILDLGTGTGETAARILALYPEAALVGIDESAAMLAHARSRLGAGADLGRRVRSPAPGADGADGAVTSRISSLEPV